MAQPKATGMNYPDQKNALAKRIASTRTLKGGWSHYLDPLQPVSVVSTAHALAILRVCRHEHSDELVKGGLEFLSKAPQQHAASMSRGPYARYYSFGLWGLTRFPDGLVDPGVFRGASASARWLVDNALEGGGWAACPGAQGDTGTLLSLSSTMPAVLALERFRPYVRGKQGQRYRDAVDNARGAVVRAASRTGTGSAWSQRSGKDHCPGTTGLAVLTLAGGSEDDRAVARRGISHLVANPATWQTQIHRDELIDNVNNWYVMSFSVCLRAILHPCAEHLKRPPGVINGAVKHMASLWNEDQKAWSSTPGRAADMTASHAVVSAARGLKNAWPFNPYLDPRGRDLSRNAKAEPAGFPVVQVFEKSKEIRIGGFRGRENKSKYLTVPFKSDNASKGDDADNSTRWALLLAVASKRFWADRAQGDHTLHRACSPEELNTELERLGREPIKEDSIRKAMDRLNRDIGRQVWNEFGQSFHRLVEPMESPDSMRWGIEKETRIEFREGRRRVEPLSNAGE